MLQSSGMPRSLSWLQICLLLLSALSTAAAFDGVDWDDANSIKAAARTIAYDTMTFYKGNISGGTVGILPGPPPDGDYYWWEAGNLWGTMLDYWHYTRDSSYNTAVMDAMVHQGGTGVNFMTPNWTASLGNDDQGFWGMAAMTAAEVKFVNPPTDQPQWLALAQGVFNTMASPDRHDNTCGGGLRWQIYYFNNGYGYKNSISNGCFFNIAARLARYTGNKTFADWADKEWAWETGVGFLTPEGAVYDGGHVENNCTEIDKAQYTYNAAIWLHGAAFMYSYTTGSTQQTWLDRVDTLLNHMLKTFFPDNILTEIQCQSKKIDKCGSDALSFKAVSIRYLVNVAKLIPKYKSKIMPYLQASAKGALAQCSGGDNGRMCGYQWDSGIFDGRVGAGQQMSALAVTIAMLYDEPGIDGPVTNKTGGTSKGDPDAGGSDKDSLPGQLAPISTADRAGAGILTAIILIGAVSTFGWMVSGMSEMGTTFS